MCNCILHKLHSGEPTDMDKFLLMSNAPPMYTLQKEYFEAAVAVNLTSLLCIISLFVSVNESLPKTAGFKLIDIW